MKIKMKTKAKKTTKKSKTTKAKPKMLKRKPAAKGKKTTAKRAAKGATGQTREAKPSSRSAPKQKERRAAMSPPLKKVLTAAPKNIFNNKRMKKSGNVVTLGAPITENPGDNFPPAQNGQNAQKDQKNSLFAPEQRNTAQSVNKKSGRHETLSGVRLPIKQPPVHAIGHGKKSHLA